MIISVPRETAEGETRVALTPDVAAKWVKEGMDVRVEKGAGETAHYPDAEYEEAGVTIVDSADDLYKEADLVMRIQPPTPEEIKQIKKGTVLVCLLWALQNRDLVETLKEQGVRTLGMDAIPRISRAQNMDVLSSMSSIAGYKSALIAADTLDKYMPMMMTAAGTIPPAKVLVLGAGVAGLQAIATARRLGGVVEAFDIRPAVKEQVESLGADFIEIEMEEDAETEGGYAKEQTEDQQEKQRQVIHEHAKKSDIIITTALIPGKPAPRLVTEAMVNDMKPGSVIVDLAAEQGGNCDVTEADQTVNHNGVRVVGPVNLPATMAFHASQLYAKNMSALLRHLIKEGEITFDFEDEITQYTTITYDGDIISPTIKEAWEA